MIEPDSASPEIELFPLPGGGPGDAGTSIQNQEETSKENLSIASYELQRKRNEDRRLDAEHEKRFEIEHRIWLLTCWYLGVVGLMIFLEGAHGTSFLWWKFTWHLSETIVVTILTTTMATVLGLILIVIKYFFKDSNSAKGN